VILSHRRNPGAVVVPVVRCVVDPRDALIAAITAERDELAGANAGLAEALERTASKRKG